MAIYAVILVLAIGGSFYGGMRYGQTQTSSQVSTQRGQFAGSGAGGQGGAMRRNGTNFVSGQILSKDDKSITVTAQGGGSKIVFFPTTVEVGKFVSGALTDLAVGQNVSANGKANSDGSITATSIQIRPAGMPGIGGAGGRQGGAPTNGTQPVAPGTTPTTPITK